MAGLATCMWAAMMQHSLLFPVCEKHRPAMWTADVIISGKALLATTGEASLIQVSLLTLCDRQEEARLCHGP